LLRVGTTVSDIDELLRRLTLFALCGKFLARRKKRRGTIGQLQCNSSINSPSAKTRQQDFQTIVCVDHAARGRAFSLRRNSGSILTGQAAPRN
jgi:hypothetical protein